MAAQEQLPTSILRQFGLGRETMRVLMAREMIELYISYKNLKADYVDFNLKFKKALNLLGFAAMPRRATWLHIWSRSILRNSWTDIDVDNPLESVRNTVFFRLVEFCSRVTRPVLATAGAESPPGSNCGHGTRVIMIKLT